MTQSKSVKRMLSGMACMAIFGATACAGSNVSIGEDNQGVNSGATCPAAECEMRTAVVRYPDGGAINYDPNSCEYFTGIAAEGNEWWSDGDELGWNMSAPGAVEQPGVITNRTCAPSQFAGAGSKPDSACAWKYQCVPVTTASASDDAGVRN